jgi:hypothetical protein
MAVNLPLNEMSVRRSSRLWRRIWVDWSGEPDRKESPAWHKVALEETERRVESVEATFSEWEKQTNK